MKKNRSRVFKIAAAAGALGMLMLAPVALAAEYYHSWQKSMPITFSGYTPPGGGAALTNFPALVVLSNMTAGAGFSYDDFLSPPYGDLRFAAADMTTPLDFEVELWDTNGASYVWVKVPELTSGTTINVFWGMAGAGVPDCTTNGATWSGGFQAVWHMAKTNDRDASAFRRHGTVSGSGVVSTNGVVGRANAFTTDHIVAASPVNVNSNTVSLWLYANTVSGGQRGIFTTGVSPRDNMPHMLLVQDSASLRTYRGGTYITMTNIAAQAWYHVTMVHSATNEIVYVNGRKAGQRTWDTLSNNTNFYIGSGYNANFQGQIDEIRVSGVQRTADWAWAEWMNQASNAVFNAYGAPELYGYPAVTADTVTNVTQNSALLVGTLASTGSHATAVTAYWGTADGSNNAAAWENSAVFAAPQSPGSFPVAATGLVANTAYYSRFAASNAIAVVWSDPPQTFITGEVWLEKTADASEIGLAPGTVMVHRVSATAAVPLRVWYAVGGTATAGSDYAALPGSVLLAAGQTNAAIVVAPFFDHLVEGAESVTLELLPGHYIVGAPAGATVAIADYGMVARTWSGAGTNALASNPANWVEGEAPVAGDAVVLNAVGNGKPLTWDMEIAPGAWTQSVAYSSTVTFNTVYPGRGSVTNFLVTGDVDLHGGAWTHKANSGVDLAVDRLCVTVGGDFTLGAAAAIDLDGRGFDAARGPGAGSAAASGSSRSACHAGMGAMDGSGAQTYGLATAPEEPGSGAYGRGGGAVRLSVAGRALLDGVISAQGVNSGGATYSHGAGGSILVEAGEIGGTGTVRAGVSATPDAYYASGGGRVALIARQNADFSRLSITAYPHGQSRNGGGRAGTIYLQSAAGGRLIVNQNNLGASTGQITELPSRLAAFVQDPAFGGELADVELVLTNGAFAGLSRDLRLGKVGWLAGELALNSWTLYNRAAAPVGNFPADFGGGTVKTAGTFHTFIDGVKLTRNGRILWDDAAVEWRVVTLAAPVSGGTTAINGGTNEGYYADQATLSVAALDSALSFAVWDGTLPGGFATNNPLALAPLGGNYALRASFYDAGNGSTNRWLNPPADNNWFTPINWELKRAPLASDDVVFSSGAANAVIGQDVTIRSLALTGTYAGSITFVQGATADLAIAENLYVRNGAQIAAPFSSVAGDGRGRTITVGGDALIDGRINADSCGFYYWTEGPALPHGPGYDGENKWGAAHGGRSGNNTAAPYGSLTGPVALGSGAYGTRGGGAIKLAVGGVLTVNGRISADSASGFHSGSGGSVWLMCGTLAGSGTISASAADAGSGNGGGGGRIAIEAGQRIFSGKTLASGGTGPSGNGKPGTLWDVNRFSAVGRVAINGDRYQYHFPPNAAGHVWDLAVTNGAVIHFLGYTNDVLTITNVLVAGKSSLRFDMDVMGQTMKETVNRVQVRGGRLDVGGQSLAVFPQGEIGPPAVDVSLMATSTLYVASTSHVFKVLNIGVGSTLYTMTGNTGDANAQSGGTIANPHGSGLRIVCDDAIITGALDVSYMGFVPRAGPGRGRNDGWWDGAGYGGEGGHFQLPAPNSGLCYGSLFRPSALGSGASFTGDQRGGGALLLVASNSLALAGAIRANGQSHGYGGSSGGSIWLVTRALSGNGSISATGGDGNTGGSHGGGGGGRVALEYVSGGFTGSFNVARGASQTSAMLAKTGTVFVCRSPVLGVNSFGAGGRLLDTALSVSNNNLRLERTIERWDANMRWTDTSVEISGGAPLANHATHRVSGLIPNGRYEVTLNGAPLNGGVARATGEGVVTLEVDISAAPQTLNIFEGLRGTVLMLR